MRNTFLVYPLCIVLAVLSFAAGAAAPLATTVVRYAQVDQTYAAEATVEAVRQSTVSAQIAGRIVDVRFDAGDYVEKGQVLVRIDEREVAQAVAGRQAEVASARATLENARANYERTRQLYTQKFVSQAALDKAQAEYRAAQAQAAANVAGAGQAQTLRSYTNIVAPYSGVVAERHVQLGEMATPGMPLMTGFDPRDLRVVASIPQYKLTQIKSAGRAAIEFPALNRWINATSIQVLPAIDEKTRVFQVRLELPENLRDVYPGMFARAHFVIGRTQKLAIPASAVVRRSEVTAVYVVTPGKQIRLRQIRVGETAAGGTVEVLAGLTPGEVIALDPLAAGIALKQSLKAR